MGASVVRTVAQPAAGPVLTKAALRAAERMGVSNKVIARIVGLSEASVSRMGTGAYTLAPGDKAFELAVLFVRLFRSLDAIVGSDDAAAQAWLRSDNRALGGVPVDLIREPAGLVRTVDYLDAARARI